MRVRKTVHFLEHRISAKSQAELGLRVPWTECPSGLGREDVRARVMRGLGVWGSKFPRFSH